MTPPLSDPVVGLASDMKLVTNSLAKIERQLDRVVYRDIYERDMKALSVQISTFVEAAEHRTSDVEAKVGVIEKRLDAEQAARSALIKWIVGLLLPLFLSLFDRIFNLNIF